MRDCPVYFLRREGDKWLALLRVMSLLPHQQDELYCWIHTYDNGLSSETVVVGDYHHGWA